MYAMMKELRDVALEITVATAPIKKQLCKKMYSTTTKANILLRLPIQ